MKKLFYSVLMMLGIMLFLQNCTSEREVDPKSENNNSMKIAHENNPEASCEDLGGIEGEANVLAYLVGLNGNNAYFIYEECDGGSEIWAYDDFLWCGEDSSYYGCYQPNTLDLIWQEAYDFAVAGVGPCSSRFEPKFKIVWDYDESLNNCATAYSITCRITWYCCPRTEAPDPDL
jgi:hypothetical protein